MRDDILYYCKELEKFPDDEEHRAYLMDMGIRALRFVQVLSKCILLHLLVMTQFSFSLFEWLYFNFILSRVSAASN